MLNMLNQCSISPAGLPDPGPPLSGMLWGYDSLWLNVGATNLVGQALYSKAGFTVADPGLMIAGPLRQILMRKDLTAAAGPFRQRVEHGAVEDLKMTRSQNGGVYKWQTQMEDTHM